MSINKGILITMNCQNGVPLKHVQQNGSPNTLSTFSHESIKNTEKKIKSIMRMANTLDMEPKKRELVIQKVMFQLMNCMQAMYVVAEMGLLGKRNAFDNNSFGEIIEETTDDGDEGIYSARQDMMNSMLSLSSWVFEKGEGDTNIPFSYHRRIFTENEIESYLNTNSENDLSFLELTKKQNKTYDDFRSIFTHPNFRLKVSYAHINDTDRFLLLSDKDDGLTWNDDGTIGMTNLAQSKMGISSWDTEWKSASVPKDIQSKINSLVKENTMSKILDIAHSKVNDSHRRSSIKKLQYEFDKKSLYENLSQLPNAPAFVKEELTEWNSIFGKLGGKLLDDCSLAQLDEISKQQQAWISKDSMYDSMSLKMRADRFKENKRLKKTQADNRNGFYLADLNKASIIKNMPKNAEKGYVDAARRICTNVLNSESDTSNNKSVARSILKRIESGYFVNY